MFLDAPAGCELRGEVLPNLQPYMPRKGRGAVKVRVMFRIEPNPGEGDTDPGVPRTNKHHSTMKTLKTILGCICFASVILAGAENPDGSLNATWTLGCMASAVVSGLLWGRIERRAER